MGDPVILFSDLELKRKATQLKLRGKLPLFSFFSPTGNPAHVFIFCSILVYVSMNMAANWT